MELNAGNGAKDQSAISFICLIPKNERRLVSLDLKLFVFNTRCQMEFNAGNGAKEQSALSFQLSNS